MEREKWQRRSSALICAALTLLGIYLLLKYALGVLLPFIAALAVALPLSSLAKRASRFFGGRVKAWSAFFVGVFWLLLAMILTLTLRRAYAEANSLAEYIGNNSDAMTEALSSFREKLQILSSDSSLLEKLGVIGERIGELAYSAVLSISEKGSAAIASLIGKIALATPRAVIGAVVAVVSSFYLCCDLDVIKSYLLGSLSESSREKSQRLAARILCGLKAYASAYLWLFLITFSELFLGLTLLGRRYAFLIALALAFLDLLPLFGAGLVIVPWGIILLVSGNMGVGLGMLALVAIMSVARQIIEPRLVGRKLGIHPLASLASMYIGFRAFGFWGMMLAPIAVLVLKEMRNTPEKSP